VIVYFRVGFGNKHQSGWIDGGEVMKMSYTGYESWLSRPWEDTTQIMTAAESKDTVVNGITGSVELS
jgi:hypothetical protein